MNSIIVFIVDVLEASLMFLVFRRGIKFAIEVAESNNDGSGKIGVSLPKAAGSPSRRRKSTPTRCGKLSSPDPSSAVTLKTGQAL
jgi:hypothetical protein